MVVFMTRLNKNKNDTIDLPFCTSTFLPSRGLHSGASRFFLRSYYHSKFASISGIPNDIENTKQKRVKPYGATLYYTYIYTYILHGSRRRLIIIIIEVKQKQNAKKQNKYWMLFVSRVILSPAHVSGSIVGVRAFVHCCAYYFTCVGKYYVIHACVHSHTHTHARTYNVPGNGVFLVSPASNAHVCIYVYIYVNTVGRTWHKAPNLPRGDGESDWSEICHFYTHQSRCFSILTMFVSLKYVIYCNILGIISSAKTWKRYIITIAIVTAPTLSLFTAHGIHKTNCRH